MSGPFGSQQWAYNAGGGFYGTTIDQSLRFNDGDSAHLNFTPSSAGDQKTWTWSAWIKRGTLGVKQNIFNPTRGGDATNESQMDFTANDQFQIYDSGALRGNKVTTRQFRDPSAWYHIVVALDTTDATAADRVKIYVNGERETAFSTNSNPSLNTNWGWNAAHEHSLGSYNYGADGSFFDGYMAEVHFIDGTALDPTSFGEEVNGVWRAISYSGSYGTNGFYLSFADSAAIGDDLSGNTNDWTANNLAASDVVPDSPTNNWCTLNPLDTSGSSSLLEGNLNWRETNYYKCFSTMVIPEISDTDTYYAEVYLSVEGYGVGIAPLSNSGSANNTSTTGFLAFYSNGNFYNDATTTASGYDPVVGDIISIKAGNGQIEFFLNGTSVGTPYTGLTGSYKFGAWSAGAAGTGIYWNFGQDSTFANQKTTGSSNTADQNGFGDFYYAEAANNISLCTANLPEPVIGPNSDTTSDEHFDTALWTADVTNPAAGDKSISLLFQPDLVWSKNRDNAEHHYLMDSVRGDNDGSKWLKSNSTAAEGADAIGSTTAKYDFTSTGFDIIDTDSTSGEVYYSSTSRTYVGWCWKAGGTASTIAVDAYSAGVPSIASSVSANPDAGFSIVSYTGNLTSGTLVGHGLSQKPEIIFVKNRDSAQNWTVWNKDLTSEYVLYLNLTAGQNNAPANFGTHTNQVFGVDNGVESNGSTNDMIAYCFHSVEGFSKVGKYVGNGSADGTFVYTGFRPAWVMIKCSSSSQSGNANWRIQDSLRLGYNPEGKELYADLGLAEASNSFDILSNGFKIRNISTGYNGSGATYIYLAFAESPFKYANAR